MAIEVKRIMEPWKPKTFIEFVSMIIKSKYFFPFLCTYAGLIVFVEVMGRYQQLGSLINLLSILFMPLSLTVFFIFFVIITWPIRTIRLGFTALYFKFFVQKELTQDTESTFTKFIGRPVKYINTILAGNDGFDICGSGLAYENGVVYIMEKGLAAKIPWADIRNWSWSIDGYDTTTVYGGSLSNNIAGNLQAAMENQNCQAAAVRASGFFIEVADIDYPRWQYQTVDQKVLTRWMEIFKQANEGKI